MKRILGAVVVVLSVAGCGLDAGSQFRQGYPKPDAVTVKVPGAAQGLTSKGTKRQGLEGDTAAFYSFTRGVTQMVNGAGVVILSLVKTIADYPATSSDATHAVWGPWTDALSPNTYKFTVTKNAENDFSYVLEGKGKNEADTAFRTILSGSHHIDRARPGQRQLPPRLGRGAHPARARLERGLGAVRLLAHRARPAGRHHAHFTQVLDKDTGKLIDADYTYHQEPGAGGNFEFKTAKDITGTALIEDLSVNSRWLQTGDGRSDVTRQRRRPADRGGRVNECWDSNFASRYLGDVVRPDRRLGPEHRLRLQRRPVLGGRAVGGRRPAELGGRMREA